jgi:hypothetical protein
MPARSLRGRPRLWVVSAATALALAASTSTASAQMSARVEADPDMPVREGFDTDRAIFWETPNFVPFHDPEWQPLRGVMRSGGLTEETPVLAFEAGGRMLVLVSSQMSYHHVAQGEMEGEPWMVTF